jgi:hypothetical protein
MGQAGRGALKSVCTAAVERLESGTGGQGDTRAHVSNPDVELRQAWAGGIHSGT